jgi:filamentous hemagglutinin family protein
MRPLNGLKRNRLSVLAVAIHLGFTATAWAATPLPQGASVVNGQVQITKPTDTSLQINASAGAIVNWKQFSIGSNGQVRFTLPSASSSVLNRVVGTDASQILGSLQSNGRVFLINPNGIVVGAGARIDTNSFIGSTLDLSDSDFLAGKLRFLATTGAGAIRNDGVITAGPGGRIVLIAPDIQNTGIIQAPDGQILLAAGRKLEISSLDFEGVNFEIQAPTDSVLNLGKLLAENGAVSAFAGSLRNSGEIRATRMVQDADGSISLSGSNEVTLSRGSQTVADGLSGGNIRVQSAGTTRVAGTVSATGTAGQGGSIQILGDRVALDAGARVDASGATGGGVLLVGGDFQGKNPDIQNARRVYVDADASLKADAIQSGDGGKVVVWADENTRYFGSLSARGGAAGGNGGNAEVSGKQNLQFSGSADLGAGAGQSGNLLLDPLDILVSSSGGILPTVVDQFADFTGNVVTISPTAMNNVKGTVTLQAERDIYFNDAVALTPAMPA